MKILIIEDETLAAERLQNLILAVSPKAEIVGQTKSIESSVEWLIQNTHPDLIISDIRLLDGLSFEIFEKVKINKPVIFTTAYDQYAIRAFEVNSVDYLLKPIQQEKLQRALEKLQQQEKSTTPAISYDEIIKLLQTKQPVYKSRFMVRLGQKIVALPVEKIAYFFSENKLTFAITTDQKKYPLDQALDELGDLLDPVVFFRANRQFIITFGSIAEIHPYFKGRVKLSLHPAATEEVIISSERTPEFKAWIDR